MAAAQKNRPRKEKLSIYLAKEGLGTDDLLIRTENTQVPIRLDIGAGVATLYIKKELRRPPPPWTKLFTDLPEVSDQAFGEPNSVGAILVYRLTRTFLLSFGQGFHLIRDEAIERDFGVRVTLNSVEPGKLRSLDKASYTDHPLNSRTQSSRDLDVFGLDLDFDSELLYAVTGASREPLFGTHVTGRDALTIAVTADAKGLASILNMALQRYTHSLPPEFQWYDNITRVRDQEAGQILDLLLDDELCRPSNGIVWLGEPEIVDWESQVGYAFDLSSKEAYPVLDIDDLRQYLTEMGVPLTTETLRKQSIHVVDAEHRSTKSWTAYRCIYGEVRDGGEHYILRNATWHRVRSTFVATLDGYLAGLPVCKFAFPTYAHRREDEYNAHVAANDSSFHLMDKKNTAIGRAYDKVEFCDLIKDDHALVHVKSYRSSATLSHLFAQGNVAAETFVRDEGFRVRLNPKLPAGTRLVDPTKPPPPGRYKIVYAIATTKSLPQELPFFSKVTLKNAAQTLQALRFDVELARIDVDPTLAKITVCKPQKAPIKRRGRGGEPT